MGHFPGDVGRFFTHDVGAFIVPSAAIAIGATTVAVSSLRHGHLPSPAQLIHGGFAPFLEAAGFRSHPLSSISPHGDRLTLVGAGALAGHALTEPQPSFETTGLGVQELSPWQTDLTSSLPSAFPRTLPLTLEEPSSPQTPLGAGALTWEDYLVGA